MHYEFCTILDVNYLPRGLVLYRSLVDVCDNFRLRVFCMDDETKLLLDRLQLPNVVTIAVAELEAYDPELRAVRPSRNSVEYCWTAKPSILLYSLDRAASGDIVTYIEADTMLFHDPGLLFDELGDSFALLTPVRDPGGRGLASYVTPFLPVRHDGRSRAALSWWRERCLEWCYDRVDDTRLFDLSYLNDWPRLFPGVAVLDHPGCLGEWNVRYFRVSATENGDVLVNGRPLILFHYGALWLYRGRLTRLAQLGFLAGYYNTDPRPLVWATAAPLRPHERQLIWAPYMRRLAAAIADLRRLDGSFSHGHIRLSVRELAYSTARSVLPASVRRPLKAALYRRGSLRGPGPPGSPG